MSSRLTRPAGASNQYSLSTSIHGIRRRSAASASRARVSSFSLTRSASRALRQSCGETIGGVFIGSFSSLVHDPVQAFDSLDEFFDHVVDDAAGGLRLVHRAHDLTDVVVGKLLRAGAGMVGGAVDAADRLVDEDWLQRHAERGWRVGPLPLLGPRRLQLPRRFAGARARADGVRRAGVQE